MTTTGYTPAVKARRHAERDALLAKIDHTLATCELQPEGKLT